MRVMMFMTATDDSENGVLPTTGRCDAMDGYNGELATARIAAPAAGSAA